MGKISNFFFKDVVTTDEENNDEVTKVASRTLRKGRVAAAAGIGAGVFTGLGALAFKLIRHRNDDDEIEYEIVSDESTDD